MGWTMTLQSTYDAIVAFKEREGYVPSIRQLAKELGLSSPGSIPPRLAALRDAGYVKWVPGQPRTLELLDPSGESVPFGSGEAAVPTGSPEAKEER